MACKFAVLTLALAALPVSGWAWGCSGHHIVALIAEQHLNAHARAAVNDLLAAVPISPDLARFCEDGAADPFVSAATWADDVKKTEGTGAWHYIDIPLAVNGGDANRYCEPAEAPEKGSKPGCLLSALRDELAALSNGERADRAWALRYLIHLIGDLHMPLHVSDNSDRGGNCVPLRFGTAAAPTNLHALWDYGILDSALSERHLTEQQFAAELDRRYRERFGEWTDGAPQIDRWAWEAHKLAAQVAYGKLVPAIPVEPAQSVTDCAAESAKISGLKIVIGKEYRTSAMRPSSHSWRRPGTGWLRCSTRYGPESASCTETPARNRQSSEKPFMRRIVLFLTVVLLAAMAADDTHEPVLRATLDNGLRVVIVRDPLAPVVTVEENYIAGGNETPAGFPGMAHAQEHMAFRGCMGLTADQISAIYAQLGGSVNADTQQNITQYFVTVPAQDLDVALRLDSACMQDVVDSQEQWAEERGAIEQEVSRDLSNPTYKFITRLNADLFSGTPYAHDALGTKASFDATTGEMLKKFYKDWYAPNNAILVIVGDVDPSAALASVKRLYGPIQRRPVPSHPDVNLQPVKAESFTLDSILPYSLAFLAFRMAGTSSPDFAATRILSDVISSQRADLYGLVPQGKALGTEFGLTETYPKASVGYAVAGLPAGADAAPIIAEMKKILAGYAEKGVPPALVDAAKKGEIASAEFQQNSIPELASVWSQALAGEGRQSPADIVDAMKKVSVEDVNRVAKNYLLVQNAIVATLIPSKSGEAVSGKGFGGAEVTTTAPTKPVTLPDWAEAAVKSLKVPQAATRPADLILPNGLRLIVQTEKASPTVTVIGSIKHQAALQTPPGKDGAGQVLEELFSYGTETRDRLAFQEALDDIAASESGGADFNLKVLKQYFAKGVELLADNELHPALPAEAFPVVREQAAQFTAGSLASPGYRMNRALETALLPKNDPALREATPQSISALKLADIKDYYAKVFRPDMTTIAVIGDITPAEARAVIEKWFGGWKSSGTKPKVTLPAVPVNQPSAVNVPDPTQIQDSVELAHQVAINRFDPDYYALQLGDHVLGGGFYATRLYRDLRQKAGYVYNVDNALHATETRATYSVTYGCDPENVSKARLLIDRNIAAMRTTNVSPAELQQAKALLLRQITLSESSEDSVASGFVARALVGLPLDEPVRAAKRYYDLSADQVRAAFAKWIHPDAFVQVVRGPAPK